jgi:hypothetical protein
MLEAARCALCEVGVLQANDPMPPFTVRMSGNLNFLCYPPSGEFYLVKIGLQNDLRREFEGFSAGHAAFPHGVPRPLALSHHRSFPTLVTTGIPLTPLGPLSMRSPAEVLRRSLADFFARSSVAFRVDAASAHSQRIRQAVDRLPETLRVAGERYVEAIAVDADRLPAVRQHGDFSVNNLGMHGRFLVILDWEDYGRECLPGYDLALLLLALNGFSAASVRDNTRDRAEHAWILRAGSEGTGIPPDLFLRLLPAYLALTVRMKTEAAYGHALQSRAISALTTALHDFGTRQSAGERR